MTAEEFFKYKYDNFTPSGREIIDAKEYARIKCEELLKIVAETARVNIKYEYSGNVGEYLDEYAVVDKDSILNAVDLGSFIE